MECDRSVIYETCVSAQISSDGFSERAATHYPMSSKVTNLSKNFFCRISRKARLACRHLFFGRNDSSGPFLRVRFDVSSLSEEEKRAQPPTLAWQEKCSFAREMFEKMLLEAALSLLILAPPHPSCLYIM